MTAARTDVVGLEALTRAVADVADPELGGVTIGQLGMVRGVRRTGASELTVDLSPTFLGCVAVGLIALDIENTVMRADPSLTGCAVNIVHNTWSTDRISGEGVANLHDLGIVVIRSDQVIERVACPYCGEQALERRGGTGPTRCRTVGWCTACRNVVEIMETAATPEPESHTYAHV